jgi:hypothetical protein
MTFILIPNYSPVVRYEIYRTYQNHEYIISPRIHHLTQCVKRCELCPNWINYPVDFGGKCPGCVYARLQEVGL